MTKPPPQQLTLSIRVLDVAAARRYLRELRALCDEAMASRDERVFSLTLAVVADQRRNVQMLSRLMEMV